MDGVNINHLKKKRRRKRLSRLKRKLKARKKKLTLLMIYPILTTSTKRRRVKMKIPKLIAPLAILAITACSTTEYVYVKPKCSPSVKPAIPTITNDELSSISDDTYLKLHQLKARLVNWGMENQEIIKAVCK